jgi:hypothetical protein
MTETLRFQRRNVTGDSKGLWDIRGYNISVLKTAKTVDGKLKITNKWMIHLSSLHAGVPEEEKIARYRVKAYFSELGLLSHQITFASRREALEAISFAVNSASEEMRELMKIGAFRPTSEKRAYLRLLHQNAPAGMFPDK